MILIEALKMMCLIAKCFCLDESAQEDYHVHNFTGSKVLLSVSLLPHLCVSVCFVLIECLETSIFYTLEAEIDPHRILSNIL